MVDVKEVGSSHMYTDQQLVSVKCKEHVYLVFTLVLILN